MGYKIKFIILIVLGVSLLIVGINMRAAKNAWNETNTTEETIPGTKGRNAAIGAGAGALGGGILAGVVGGTGIVVAGTGFGIPAGAGLILIAAALGGSGGAIAGAATGKSATIASTVTTITHVVPAYETWQWAAVVVAGGILLLLALLEMRKLGQLYAIGAEQSAGTNDENAAAQP